MGPRSTLWLLQSSVGPDNPVDRHPQGWQDTVGVELSDPWIDEQGLLASLVEALTYGDLNLSELAIDDAIRRRFMLWEQSFTDRPSAGQGAPLGDM